MKKTPSTRAQSLYSLAKGLEAKMRDVAASISSQTGVSMDEATKETVLSVGRLSDWAAYCDKIKGGNLVSFSFAVSTSLEEHKRPFPIEEIVPTSSWKLPLHLASLPALQPMPRSGSGLSLPEALGVMGVVLPDSSPLLSLVTVLGAAIATGNAVVMVPSQKYPLPALTLIQVDAK